MRFILSLRLLVEKVNVIAWMEFELAYFETEVEHFSHYTTETLSNTQWIL